MFFKIQKQEITRSKISVKYSVYDDIDCSRYKWFHVIEKSCLKWYFKIIKINEERANLKLS